MKYRPSTAFVVGGLLATLDSLAFLGDGGILEVHGADRQSGPEDARDRPRL